MTPLLYSLLRPPARAIARLFFRKLEVQGASRVPLQGPLLIAANHANMLLDPLLLGTTQPRSVSFLAKATLFRSPLLGRFLSAAGVLPVYRRSDSPGEQAKNELTFEACIRHLERRGAIGIFPEGLSHDRQAVLPLKTGCARIALEAEAQNGFALGVRITPVGLYFTARHLFRGDALVLYGDPIDPKAYFDSYRRDTHEAVRALTSHLERELKQLTVHVPRVEDEALVEPLREILALPETLPERVSVERAIVDAIEYVRETDPARYARLRQDVLRVGRWMKALKFDPEHLARRYRWGLVLRYLAPRLALAVVGFPFFLFGAANNLLPYKIPLWTARLLTRDKVEIATIKLLTGMAAFPLFYLLQTGAVARIWGELAGLLYFVALPISGLLALGYTEALSGFSREARVFALHVLKRDAMTRVRRESERVRQELDRLRTPGRPSGGTDTDSPSPRRGEGWGEGPPAPST